MSDRCEYCGQEERYGHNAICVMNEVEELRAEIERLRAALLLSQWQNYCTLCGRDLDKALEGE
jgi:hypothetical protein